MALLDARTACVVVPLPKHAGPSSGFCPESRRALAAYPCLPTFSSRASVHLLARSAAYTIQRRVLDPSVLSSLHPCPAPPAGTQHETATALQHRAHARERFRAPSRRASSPRASPLLLRPSPPLRRLNHAPDSRCAPGTTPAAAKVPRLAMVINHSVTSLGAHGPRSSRPWPRCGFTRAASPRECSPEFRQSETRSSRLLAEVLFALWHRLRVVSPASPLGPFMVELFPAAVF